MPPRFIRSTTSRFPNDVESLRSSVATTNTRRSRTPAPSVVRDRFTKLFLDLRTSFGCEPDLLPIRHPPFPPQPLLQLSSSTSSPTLFSSTTPEQAPSVVPLPHWPPWPLDTPPPVESQHGGGERDHSDAHVEQVTRVDNDFLSCPSCRRPNLKALYDASKLSPAVLVSAKNLQQQGQRLQPHRRRGAKRRLVLLALVFSLLFVNVLFLDIRLFLSARSSSAKSTPSTSTSAGALSAAAQQCILQFTLDAQSNPKSYPCPSCLPALLVATNDGNGKNDSDIVRNALAFCGLKAVFDACSTDAQRALGEAGGWLKDATVCAWAGVTCDAEGHVSSLQLTSPGMPSFIPEEVGALTSLRLLRLVGNNDVPGGPLPQSFRNLTSLVELHLESTALTPMPDDLFASLRGVQTLTLVRNAGIGLELPNSLFELPLQTLLVVSQNLSNPLASIGSSASLRSSLKTLDLRSANMTGILPASLSSLKVLVALNLHENALQGPLPASFPPQTVNAVTLSGNPELGAGSLPPAALCAAPSLSQCDLSGTSLAPGSGCGICVF